MLTSEPPHLIIDGICIFTDHALKDQLYYLPVLPQFPGTTVNGAELPMFSLIEFSVDLSKSRNDFLSRIST